MIEVFKTDVLNANHAALLLEQMHKSFADYQANFDLEDCDNILRVECKDGLIQPDILIDFLQSLGCTAEVLPDEANLLYG